MNRSPFFAPTDVDEPREAPEKPTIVDTGNIYIVRSTIITYVCLYALLSKPRARQKIKQKNANADW